MFTADATRIPVADFAQACDGLVVSYAVIGMKKPLEQVLSDPNDRIYKMFPTGAAGEES